MSSENAPEKLRGPDKPASIRLPVDLRAWLQQKANENSRSLSGEVLARLKKSKLQEEICGSQQAT